MKEKVLKINKKDYNIAKSLSDRDFGTLVRALCEYVYYGIDASPKDKILKVYYDNFKEKIDMENFFRETGRLGGIKSNELRQKPDKSGKLNKSGRSDIRLLFLPISSVRSTAGHE